MGLCGGYQMLGQWIDDPDGLEGPPGKVEGLGHLDISTRMAPQKRLAQVRGREVGSSVEVMGYEIHIGQTEGPDTQRAWLEIEGRSEGAASQDGRVRGCYIHGLFASDAFRAGYLATLGAQSQLQDFESSVEGALDALADHLRAHMDVDKLLELAREV